MTCKHLLAVDGACPSCHWIAPEQIPIETEGPAIPDPVEIRAHRCRRSFAWFVRESWHVLEATTHLDWGPACQAVCDHVQWILEDWLKVKKDKKHKQLVQNACFSLPPGVLKTRIIIEIANAWMWIDTPTWTVMCLSINPNRARRSARNTRKVIMSEWYQQWFQPSWELDRDAEGDFGNTAGGFRVSRGITAEIAGDRTDCLLVDDPNAPDDEGKEEPVGVINALWDSTLYSRVNDLRFSVRIIVQQRIDVDDLTGHIKTKSPEDWMFFVTPLLFDPDRRCETPYGWSDWRQMKDEPLDPIRFTPDVIAKLRKVFGPTRFQAQCQQDPDKGDGEMFKLGWWRFFRYSSSKELDPATRYEGCNQEPAYELEIEYQSKTLDVSTVVVTMDATGGSTSADASHVGLLVCAIKGERKFVLHDCAPGPRKFFEQMGDLDAAILKAAEITGKRHIKVLVEKKAYGGVLLETLEKHIKETGYKDKDGRSIGVSFEPYDPPGSVDKGQRAQAMEPTLVLGEVYLPDGAPWVPEFLKEFKRFPKKPNDRVDSLAQFIARFAKKMTWKDAFARGR